MAYGYHILSPPITFEAVMESLDSSHLSFFLSDSGILMS